MKDKENEKYVKVGITAAMVAFFTLIVFFFLYRASLFSRGIRIVIGILRPFVYGGAMAYIVRPLCASFERRFGRLFKGKHPGLSLALAIFFSVAIALVIVLAVLFLIIPQLTNSITEILKVLPGQLEQLLNQLNAAVEDVEDPRIREYLQTYLVPTTTDMTTNIGSFLKKNFGGKDFVESVLTIAPGLASQVVSTFNIILDLFIGVIVSIYLLFRRKKMAAQMKLMTYGFFKPSWAVWIVQEARFADHVFNGFFIGKLLDSAIIGILCFIGCLIMGFSSSLLIAVIVGVTNIIPFFGPYIGAIPCFLLLLLEDPTHALMFLVFIILLQQLDGNVIGPKILGDSTGLSALWVMFAILLFGGLWGIIGMLIGVPLMAVIYDIVRQITMYNVRRRGREDMVADYYASFHSSELHPTESGDKTDV